MNILIKDTSTDKYISNERYQPVVFLEYFKVDKVNVFEDIKRGKTITSSDINNLRNKIEDLNIGYHNESCAVGDIPGYRKYAGECGNSDIIIEGKPREIVTDKNEDCPTYIDWNNPGHIDDRVTSFVDTIRKANIQSTIEVIPRLAPYNGCSTCDQHTCDCYAVHYGRIECQICNQCDAYVSCTSCDMSCYVQSRKCSCDMSCDQEATSCTCDNRCYSYSSCSCYSRNY